MADKLVMHVVCGTHHKPGSRNTYRMIHDPSCYHVTDFPARRRVRIPRREAIRLVAKSAEGDGRTRVCQICRPINSSGFEEVTPEIIEFDYNESEV